MTDQRIEETSAEIHKCYCRAYERRFGKPYWTNGDYSKLDEPTKDYDREMARWHLQHIDQLKHLLKVADDENKRLDAEVERFKVLWKHEHSNCDTLQATVERYRKVLAKIVERSEQDSYDLPTNAECDMVKMAKEGLNQGEK